MPGISVPCLISAVSTLAPGVLALAPGELPQATMAANTSGASAAARIVANLFILIKILLLVNV
jgi:hypothetical protein